MTCMICIRYQDDNKRLKLKYLQPYHDIKDALQEFMNDWDTARELGQWIIVTPYFEKFRALLKSENSKNVHDRR